MDGRSQTGCWTCRARRKRCDENRQTCSTCNYLGLPCHGYGPRPAWMDGGSLQRAQAIEFKNIVKQRPRQRWPSGGSIETITTMDDRSSSVSVSAMNQSTGLGRRRGSVPMEPSTNVSVPEAQMFQSLSPTSLNAGTLSDFPNAFNTGRDAMTPLDVFNLPKSCNQLVGLGSANWPNSSPGGIYDNFTYLEDIQNIRPDIPATMIGSDSHLLNEHPPAQIANEPTNQVWLYPSPIETNTPMNEQKENPFSQSITISHSPVGQLVALKTWELDALWYYFERIFPQRFPFLDPPDVKIVCNELWQLASTSRCCLSFLLAQSLTIQQMQLKKLGIEPQSHLIESAKSRRKVAVEELRLLVQHLNITRENGGMPDVDSQTEVEVCLTLATLSKESRAQLPWHDVCALLKDLALISLGSLSANTSLLSSFYRNLLISLSVLSCASTSAEPYFARRFRDQLLEDKNQFCVQKVLGCDKRVLKYILDITELQIWKESVERSGTASVVELVKRAIPIENELRQIQPMHLHEASRSALFSPQARQELAITKIMACAAGVYLHGTLCGLRPEVPELKSAVAETIAAIKLLPGAAFVRGLSWSITIAAVASDGSDKKFFEELGQGVLEEFGRCELFLGLKTAFEFWERRDYSIAEKREYTWKEALSDRDGAVLLFV